MNILQYRTPIKLLRLRAGSLKDNKFKKSEIIPWEYKVTKRVKQLKKTSQPAGLGSANPTFNLQTSINFDFGIIPAFC